MELSMVIEKWFVFDRVDFVPISRTSVLLLFNLRKLRVNQFFISPLSLSEGVGRESIVVLFTLSFRESGELEGGERE